MDSAIHPSNYWGQDFKWKMGGIDGEVRVVVDKLVAVLDGDGLRVASDEENEELLKMRAVFGIEEWVGVSGLKAQDRRKVN